MVKQEIELGRGRESRRFRVRQKRRKKEFEVLGLGCRNGKKK